MRLPNDEILHYKSDDGVSVIVERAELVRCKDCKHHEERSRNMSESLKVLNEILEYSYGMLTAEKYGLQHKILSMIKEQGHDV